MSQPTPKPAKRAPQVVPPAATAKYNLVTIYSAIAIGWLVIVLAVIAIRSSFGAVWGGASVLALIFTTLTVVAFDGVAAARQV